MANRALRDQLKEFARALDTSLKHNNAAAAGHTVQEDESRSAKARAKVVKVMQKKLKMYKKITTELKQQLVSAQRTDRVLELQNQAKEQERRVQSLIDENRSLLAIQRHQARKIHQREAVRQDWPQRLQSMENEIRIYREKLRKVRQRDLKFAETRKWQDSQIHALKNKVKKLNRKLGNVGGGDGNQGGMLPGVSSSTSYHTSERVRESQSTADEENAKLRKDVSLLKRTMNNDRIRHERAMKRQQIDIERLQNQSDEQQEDLLRKEKLVKLQVLQVKRLKRQLKDLVRSATPIAVPVEVPSYKIPSKPRSAKKQASIRSPGSTSRAVRPTPHVVNKGQPKPGILSTGDDGGYDEDTGFTGDMTFVTGGAGMFDDDDGGEVGPSALDLVDGRAGVEDMGEHAAATCVQTQFRGARSRRIVKQKRDEESKAASKVQSQIRGRNARRKVKHHRQQVDHAATRLQSNFRGYRDRRDVSATKDQRERDLAFQRQLEYQSELKDIAASRNSSSSSSSSSSSNNNSKKSPTKVFTPKPSPPTEQLENVTRVIDSTDNAPTTKVKEQDDDETQIAILDDAGEWDDDALAAALDGPVPTTKVTSFSGEEKSNAEPSSFSFPKTSSASSAAMAPKADEAQAAELANASRFGPGRKKKKKKYY